MKIKNLMTDEIKDSKEWAEELGIGRRSIERYADNGNAINGEKYIKWNEPEVLNEDKPVQEEQKQQDEDDIYLFCISNMRMDIQTVYNNYGLAIDEHEIEPFTIEEMEEQPWFGEDQREVVRKQPDYARIWKAQYLAEEIQNGNITVNNCCNIMGVSGPIVPGLHFCEKQYMRTHQVRDFRPSTEVGTKRYTIEEWYQMVGEKMPSFKRHEEQFLDLNDIELD